MSTAKAKQAEQAENTAEVKATYPGVYFGPTVKKTVQKYMVYAYGALPPAMINRIFSQVLWAECRAHS